MNTWLHDNKSIALVRDTLPAPTQRKRARCYSQGHHLGAGFNSPSGQVEPDLAGLGWWFSAFSQRAGSRQTREWLPRS